MNNQSTHMITPEFQDIVRVRITRFIFQHGFAPEVTDLSSLLHVTDKQIQDALQLLAANHALVLHPASYKIWVAHPFALFPTLFWVISGRRQWWGNCIWCSLGIAALTDSDTQIFTKLGGEKRGIVIDIKDGQVIQDTLIVHFPIRARLIWENVIYTCANMLVFENEKEVTEWCTRHHVHVGESQPITKVFDMAKRWYGNYLLDSWTRKTPQYAQQIFNESGFVGDFWKIDGA
jgi:hypothetical protein